MAALVNPEITWDPHAQVRHVSRAEVERCLGPTIEAFHVLSGGLANANVRIGDKVLRLYRRDALSLGIEKTLLQRPWHSLVVPTFLNSGQDFLLMSFEPHGPIEDGPEHGAALGAALAEIHATNFKTSGLLDGSLQVKNPFPDFIASMREYIAVCLDSPQWKASAGMGRRMLEFYDSRAGLLREVQSPAVLLHADFKASNLHWSPRGLPLILDWEFAYAGPALMDLGQLFRWDTTPEFRESFGKSYRSAGGRLPQGWPDLAATLDLINLTGLITNMPESSTRERQDVMRRINQTIGGTKP